MSTETKDTTIIKEVDMDLEAINSFLAVPGAENVIIPTSTNTVLSPPADKDKFLDNPDVLDNEEKDKLDENGKVIPLTSVVSTATLDAIVNTDEDSEEEKEKKAVGRQKIDKSGLVELTKKLIESGVLSGFKNDKGEDEDIEKYTQKDYEDLIVANFSEREKVISEKLPLQFFDSLSDELKYAAKYEADGGKDMKGLFRALAQVEEARDLDPKNEKDQEAIIRNYLSATGFGSPEDIQEEIDGWKNNEQLENKAIKFKPKWDAMQEQVVEQKLVQQQEITKKQVAQSHIYMENVYKALEPGEINGLVVDKKTQSMLYAGLVQPNYPSMSGRNTNLLGHLLEKYQFAEPNHGLIAEALWLLADPEGYKTKVRDVAVKENTIKTVRTLKTEEARKITSTADDQGEDSTRKSKTNTIKRPEPNIFKR